MRFRIPHLPSAAWVFALAVLAAVLMTAWPAQAAPADASPAVETQARALQRAADAVVGLQVQAVEDARSSRNLGQARQGSGVVVGSDGLVLTIGYLILEADQVQLVTDDGRQVPARVVGYDVATGFGLVQALVPLRIDAVPFGAADGLKTNEALMVVQGGAAGSVAMAQLVSQRAFSGYWEYHLDQALFTSPPTANHSGAGLFNAKGELVGIGSLFVADAMGPGQPRLPGNMFVPVDVLQPLLTELRRTGSTRLSQRAWLGINCTEQAGEVKIVRVADDSPADVAGLQPGDRILRIDGQDVAALEGLWKRLWAGGAAERAVLLDIEREGARQTITVHSVDRMKTLRRAQGV